jgi:ABC-type polysaccharide/polyol phosphate export permease
MVGVPTTVVYESQPVTAAGWFRELARHRDLLYMIAWREVKVKYKQSVMGILWALLLPIVIVFAGVVVRYAFSLISGQAMTLADTASVMVKAVPWAFFVSAIRFSSNSLIGNAELVTKIYMPREIFPFAAVLSALLDFAIASAVLVIVLSVVRIGVSIHLLWVPVLVSTLVLIVVGLALVLSASSLFLRDVKYLVEVLLTFAIFFTPVFYDAHMVGQWEGLMMLNPIAPILQGLQDVVVKQTAPSLQWLAYAGGVGIVGCIAGVAFFKRVEPFFAESA